MITNIKPFSLLIKPASADCNLRCTYCFYIDKSKLYPRSTTHRMSNQVLEKLISSYMHTLQPQYAFAWQGGEPTLMGIDFYRKVTQLQIQYGFSGASVANHLQTNAVLMTDELAAHLYRYNFLVGVSLDGPADIHNYFRKYKTGKGSHAQVIRGLEVLRRNKVDTNILTLITAISAGQGKRLYDYLVDQGIFYHQYIPCVEFNNKGLPMPYALTPEAWGEFLCTVFDRWSSDSTRQISVRYFDALLHYLVTGDHIICHMNQECNQYFMVEHNGDVYPCDFFAENDLRLGNICNDSWQDLLNSQQYNKFGNSKSNWHEDCCHCQYLRLCSGDCIKHRVNDNLQGINKKSWLCRGYKMFFNHALRKLQDMALEIKKCYSTFDVDIMKSPRPESGARSSRP